MRANLHTTLNLSLFVLLLVVSYNPHQCCSQSDSDTDYPQNVEVFYPFSSFPIIPPPPAIEPQPYIPPPLVLQSKSSTKSAVGKAVGITAASTLVLCGLIFFILFAYSRRRKRENENITSNSAVVPHAGGTNPANGNFVRFQGGNVKGVIVDENGLDVLYWKNLEGGEDGDNRSSFKRSSYKNLKDEQREEEKRVVSSKSRKPPVQEVPLLRGMSSTSQSPVWSVEREDEVIEKAPSFSCGVVSFNVEDKKLENRTLPPPPGRRFEAVAKVGIVTAQPPQEKIEAESKGKIANPHPSNENPTPPGPPLPPPPARQFFESASKGQLVNPQQPHESPPLPGSPPPPPPPAQQFEAVSKDKIVNPQQSHESPPPPAQQLEAASPAKIGTPPAPPPPKVRGSPPAPPPPGGGSSAQSMKPPAPPSTRSSSLGEGTSSKGNEERAKLKPLHWDKVNPNANHSMVWDKIDNGSFKFDGDLMEALFGYVATNRKSPNRDTAPTDDDKPSPPSQIFILETRKSQNTAIVVKSLGLTRKEIIDALMEGRGLNADMMEKLTRISPTEEEKSQIIAFNGDPTRLADAESFLYHILKAVPSAFSRFNAMLFRSNCDTEVSNIKECLQTLESACNELRTRGLFLKLLEAVLKAGNRLNAGTSRGNAKAFNLTALRKLSDVKSTDGKTTLLQFVVQEVVRAEGKRCVLNRNRSLSGTSSQSSDSDGKISNDSAAKDDQEREYMKLGLPVIGGLSTEFSNVKKAAMLDYDVLFKTSSALQEQVIETRRVVAQCGDNDNGGFADEMRSFLDTAELEINVLKEELTRVMELVKKTTDYYQTGTSREKNVNPLQLFVIVGDFLGMVDQVCIDISRDVQKRRSGSTFVGSSSSPESPRVFRFPKLPPNFMSDSLNSNSSEHDDERTELT